MKLKKLHFFKFLLLTLPVLWSLGARAQATNCTNHQYVNGNNTITFNVENTNTTDIILTDISTNMFNGSGGTYTFTLLYNTAAVNSSGSSWTQGIVGAGQNGWVSAGSATVTIPSHTTPQSVLTGLSVTIPAGATYGFALTSTGTIGYQTLTAGAGVNNFSNGGVNLKTGDNIGWGAVALPATPGNYPRGWSGCIGWISSVPCSGVPNTPVASGPASICPGSNFTLTATGMSVGTGLTYQWEQYNTATSSWDPITNATSVNYTVSGGISSSTDYRLVTTCSNGGGQSTSNTVTVNVNAFFACYCSPNTGTNLNSGFASNYISSVEIPGTTLNNPTTTTPANGYNLFYPSTATTTATLTQGVQYTINTTIPWTGYYMSAWIDYDQNGTFDVSEHIPLTVNGTNGTATFIVPLTATPGQTGMRLRVYWQNYTAGQACATFMDYETEDYVITIDQALPCSGQPNVVTASGPASACAGDNFNLSASGFSTGLGLTYQWEMYDNTTSSWVAISGATTPLYTVGGGISANTDFRFVTTCSNGGGQDVSNTVTVNVAPFFNCYCASGATNAGDEEIYSVTLNGTNSNTFSGQGNGCTQVAPGPGSILDRYSNFTTLGVFSQLMQGSLATFNVEENECNGPTYYAFGTAIWIDWNQNGDFSDPGEQVFVENTTTAGPRNVTGTFLVPATALPGQTGMRITVAEGYSGNSLTPCLSYGYGETEDYTVEVTVPTPCSGTPATPVASGPSSLCPGTTFTVSATGATVGSGITYQWEQYNTGTSSWDPITGATDPVYTVTGGITAASDYRLTTTCANGGAQSQSNTVTVNVNPFFTCYCGPATGITLNSGFATNYITNVTIPGTGLNNTTTTQSPNGYTLFYPTNATNTATLTQGVQYTLNTTLQWSGYYMSAWIDFDGNGTFDASEFIPITVNNVTGTANFTVPITATPGQTGMRLRLYWTNYSSGQACATYYDYETEDYVITIDPALPCSGTPATPTVSGPTNICPGVGFTLTANGATTGLGISYQWEEYNTATSSWGPIMGATSTIYNVTGGITAATQYRFVTTCSNGGGQSTSATQSVAVNPPLQCYCIPAYTNHCMYGDDLNSFVLNGENGTSFNDLNTGCTTGGYDDRTAQPAVHLAQGTTYTGTINSNYSGSEYANIWIDFGDDGIFDPTDAVGNVGPFGTANASFNITIPATAALGTHRMRVRVAYNASPAGGINPCTNYSYGETHDYTVSVIVPPTCAAPTGLGVANMSSTATDVSWSAVTGAVGYEYAVTNTNTPPATGTATTNTSATAVPFTPGSQIYYLHVRTDCGSGNLSAWMTYSFMPSNNASGAMLLSVGAGCTGNPYNNTIATHSVNEPYASCNNASTGVHSMWFKFVAPASGAVRISTDISPQGTLVDSKVGLFSATDSSNYGTFSIISCDEDGGIVGSGYNSIVYAVGLTAGQTYYVQVDGYGATSVGTYCITVDELSSSMIATSGNCSLLQSPEMNNPSYTGWFPLLTDGASGGKLVALLRNTSGAAGLNYSTYADPAALTVNTGAVRISSGGIPYLDRNYKINNTVNTTNTDVRFFFLDTELSALAAVVGNTLTPSMLNVTKQSGTTCQANFNNAAGTSSVLLQTASGSLNGAGWIEVQTNSFSNFYIMAGSTALKIQLDKISAVNVGARNRVDWSTAAEERGDAFEVERSLDGANFTKIGTVAARGSASGYSFLDNAAAPGKNYYRLKMTTPSGEFSYSEVVNATVKNANAFGMEAFPNPVTNNTVTVNVYGTAGVNALISVTDVTGKVIKMIDVKNNTATIDMTGLAAGVYLIKYSDDKHSQTIKVDKQ